MAWPNIYGFKKIFISKLGSSIYKWIPVNLPPYQKLEPHQYDWLEQCFPNQWQYCPLPPRDMELYLETLLVVTTGGRSAVSIQWAEFSDAANTQGSPHDKDLSLPNADSAKGEKSCSNGICVSMLDPRSLPLFSDATTILNLLFTIGLFLNILSRVCIPNALQKKFITSFRTD